MTYYAICNVNGPISFLLDGDTETEALESFAAADHRAMIDDVYTDAEDALGMNGEEMSEDEFEQALKSAGGEPIRSLAEVTNAHAGTVAHEVGGWYLWKLPNP